MRGAARRLRDDDLRADDRAPHWSRSAGATHQSSGTNRSVPARNKRARRPQPARPRRHCSRARSARSSDTRPLRIAERAIRMRRDRHARIVRADPHRAPSASSSIRSYSADRLKVPLGAESDSSERRRFGMRDQSALGHSDLSVARAQAAKVPARATRIETAILVTSPMEGPSRRRRPCVVSRARTTNGTRPGLERQPPTRPHSAR